MLVPVSALAASVLILASAFALAGSIPFATCSRALVAATRASCSETAGQGPIVSLPGLPLKRYRTAQLRWPEGCSCRYKPGVLSGTSRRTGSGLAFSIYFVVSRMALPSLGFRVTEPAVYGCYLLSPYVAPKSQESKQFLAIL